METGDDYVVCSKKPIVKCPLDNMTVDRNSGRCVCNEGFTFEMDFVSIFIQLKQIFQYLFREFEK